MSLDLSRAVWRKSTHSGTGNDTCVEVAGLPGAVAVRDSTDPDGPKLVFGVGAWRAFVRGVSSGGVDG
ncbi:DUF397 domain-containing protein [Actinomadura napierensis]|uniref:DUF397 domain-containing protein n=1 Tax=Actinomadura napierensis TaxID=267854 RepID=A0ABN2YNA3_9ACTN